MRVLLLLGRERRDDVFLARESIGLGLVDSAAIAASCSANFARFSLDFFLEIGFPLAAFLASLFAFASACVESNFKRPSILGLLWSQ